MGSQRLIRVDDTDPSIQYTGGAQDWFQDGGSRDTAGNFGPTFKHTLHGMKSNGSFAFSFQGSRVNILGTNNRVNTTTGWDPSWECFVDNVSIGATDPFPYDENNWVLCDAPDLNGGPHEISVNVTSTTGQPFWFDYVQYAPSSTVSEESAYIVVDNLDPGINYGVGWGALGGSANMTSTKGSLLKLNFTGIGLGWVGFIPTELPHNASSATYSIDGGSPVSFNLPGLPSTAKTTVYNQVFFTTPQLSPGPHTLLVVHGGTNQQTPLTLDYLIVTNTSVASATSSLNSNPVSTSTTTTNSVSTNSVSTNPVSTGSVSGSGGPPTGAIVGGVVGGIAAIVFALLFLFLSKRRKRARQGLVMMPGGRKPQPNVTPFVTGHESSSDPRPMHSHNASASQFSNPSYSTSDNSWGTVPSNTRAARKQTERASRQPISHVMHQDSGMRFHGEDDAVHIPPGYSAE